MARRRRFRVAGDSMYPLLRDGDEVLVDVHAYRDAAPVEGDVVLARHPLRRDVTIVKRVAQVLTDGRVFLVGEDPLASSDSRGFGPVTPDRLVGRVEMPG